MSQNTTPLSRSPVLKLVVLSPLLLSAAAASLLLALAPGAWGAAGGLGLAPWVPTASSVMLGLPVIVMSVWGSWVLLRRMTGLFEVDLFSAGTGGAAHWVASICLVTFAGTMGSESAYESLGAGSMTTAGFTFLASIAAIVGGFLLAGLTMVYVWSVSPGRKTRLAERREDEPDFVADWGRRRRSG